MSADNGIYILSTPSPNGREFRVCELGAIDNLEWDDVISNSTSDPDVHIKNARRMWHNCQVFVNRTDALVKADELSQNCYTEYGICFINIEREF